MCFGIQFTSASEAEMEELVLEMRHDPTLHLDKNDSMVNFSQSSQYWTIETFLQRHLDFTHTLFYSISGLVRPELEIEEWFEFFASFSYWSTALEDQPGAITEVMTSEVLDQTVHEH